MGTRAVVAYRREDANGEELTTITTVQRATFADKNYPQALRNLMHVKGLSFREATRYLFSMIAERDHITALDSVRLSDPENKENYRHFWLGDSATRHTFLGVPVLDREDGAIVDFVISAVCIELDPEVDTTGRPLKEIVATHYNNEDGISVYYDEVNDPSTVHFYRDPDYNYPETFVDATFSTFTPDADYEFLA